MTTELSTDRHDEHLRVAIATATAMGFTSLPILNEEGQHTGKKCRLNDSQMTIDRLANSHSLTSELLYTIAIRLNRPCEANHVAMKEAFDYFTTLHKQSGTLAKPSFQLAA